MRMVMFPLCRLTCNLAVEQLMGERARKRPLILSLFGSRVIKVVSLTVAGDKSGERCLVYIIKMSNTQVVAGGL